MNAPEEHEKMLPHQQSDQQHDDENEDIGEDVDEGEDEVDTEEEAAAIMDDMFPDGENLEDYNWSGD